MPDSNHPDENLFRQQTELESHFRPGAPVETNDLLKGRGDQISRVLTAINGIGEHAAVYGEPGVGKTSLSLVMQSILNTTKIAACIRVQCSSDDDFQMIWTRFGEYLEREARKNRLPYGRALTEAHTSALATGNPLNNASDVFFFLDQIADVSPLVIIIDEFDKVAEWNVRSSMSNLIKTLSDERIPATIVIVGVGDDLADLVAEHTSIERNLRQIPMSRLEQQELHEILETGFRAAGLEWEETVTADIVKVSRGLPHYVHLMGRHAGRLAILSGATSVEDRFWVEALKLSVGDAQETVARQYATAVGSYRQDALYAQALLACALTSGDEWGYFQPADVSSAYSKIMGGYRSTADYYRHLRAFTSEERECPLIARGEGRASRYRFRNPLLQPYVILRGLQTGMVQRADLPPLTTS